MLTICPLLHSPALGTESVVLSVSTYLAEFPPIFNWVFPSALAESLVLFLTDFLTLLFLAKFSRSCSVRIADMPSLAVLWR